MSHGHRRWLDRLLLPLSLGIADGILNALILASATVLYGRGLDIGLALRVATVSFVSAVFTIFVAEYAQLRAELARAERQLSLTQSGRLAAGALGQQVIREATEAAVVASVASFIGAVAPLLVGVGLRNYRWTALAIAILALGALGASLATVTGGRRSVWIGALVVCGAAIAAVGVALDIA